MQPAPRPHTAHGLGDFLTTPQRLAGLIGLRDLLHARVRTLDEELQRERVLRLHRMIPARARQLVTRSISR